MSYCQAAVGACCHPSCACGVGVPASRSFTHAELVDLMRGAFKECKRITPEQEKLQADLIAQYGQKVFTQARELSGLTLCITSLGADALSFAERAHLVRQASIHVVGLMDTVVPDQSMIVECARRIDAALDLWMADEIEERDGLPPA